MPNYGPSPPPGAGRAFGQPPTGYLPPGVSRYGHRARMRRRRTTATPGTATTSACTTSRRGGQKFGLTKFGDDNLRAGATRVVAEDAAFGAKWSSGGTKALAHRDADERNRACPAGRHRNSSTLNETREIPLLTTRVAKDHAITAGQINPFANIIRGRPQFSADPDLIAGEGASPAFEQDRVSSS